MLSPLVLFVFDGSWNLPFNNHQNSLVLSSMVTSYPKATYGASLFDLSTPSVPNVLPKRAASSFAGKLVTPIVTAAEVNLETVATTLLSPDN